MGDRYETPLCKRYASRRMQYIFSDDFKFTTWRKLWIALAESERALGIPITEQQISELKANADNLNLDRATEIEHTVRHDVMSHILAYGEQCPAAKPIIHLGATSCYVGDNTDIIQMRLALEQIRSLLIAALRAVCGFAEKYKALPTLAYTHFQTAQPTTVGKRATLWAYDLVCDIEQLDHALANLKLLGCKGATGTCASFLELFDGDLSKVRELERMIAARMGFESCVPVSGQTYTRKIDFNVLSVLAGIAQSAHKFSNDIRLLAHMKEIEEPFEAGQVGSSAMPYKRNPMRSERIASLSRHILSNIINPEFTAAGQWLERTLDDSANRRLAIPEMFLATDAVLSLYINVISGAVVYPGVIARHMRDELPFIASENILMYCVKQKGGDRQTLHEAIRRHSQAAANEIKQNGRTNDLLDRILADPAFGITRDELDELLDPSKFTGAAEAQTDAFLAEVTAPILAASSDGAAEGAEINV